jgi:hypothetical protein
MCSRFGPAFGVIVVAALAVPPATHASDERHSPRVGSVTHPVFEIRPDPLGQSSSAPKADPVGDGIAIGALIGAGTGLAFMGWAYAQCDDTCDAPEPAPMYLMAGGVSAAVGGVIGWLIDASRKNTNGRVSVAAAATPRRAALHVRVRW